jgi:hypothetical protein
MLLRPHRSRPRAAATTLQKIPRLKSRVMLGLLREDAPRIPRYSRGLFLFTRVSDRCKFQHCREAHTCPIYLQALPFWELFRRAQLNKNDLADALEFIAL